MFARSCASIPANRNAVLVRMRKQSADRGDCRTRAQGTWSTVGRRTTPRSTGPLRLPLQIRARPPPQTSKFLDSCSWKSQAAKWSMSKRSL